MIMNIKNMIRQTLIAGAAVLAMTMTACNPEPDESDLYTFTGETIESFIAKDKSLTAFNYILSRVDYDAMMAAYGHYTCFAPVNEGVAYYVDSLYNDPEAVIPHNGMRQPEGVSADFDSQTDEQKLKWLSDSLCLAIAQYHITTTYNNLVSMTGTGQVLTMLGYEFSYSSDTGETVLGNKATILDSDHETVNGLVHRLDNVIPRTAHFTDYMLEHNADFSIFSQALKMTGLCDSLTKTKKDGPLEFKQLLRDNQNNVGSIWPASGPNTTGKIDNYKIGYTIFAESDAVMAANGIHSIEDLIEYANKEYGNCGEWYDYVSENSDKITISTGNDYTNRFNTLNMFVAYHIIKARMAANQLVFEKGSHSSWNYTPDADPYDYYETMLPHTIMKIWEPVSEGSGKTLLINRYQTYNTLTNEVGTMGTNHELVRRGVEVDRKNTIAATNAYIHPIKDMLVYDQMVPDGVLHERMRINCTSLFPELINNSYRYWESSNFPTGSGSRVGIPKHAFENIVYYEEDPYICLAYCTRGKWRCYQADQMQFWGRYDFAFKLPPVPSDVYEIRVVYAPMDYGSFMQYYIGSSSNIADMRPLGLPFDATIDVEDPRIGLTDAWNEDDKGLASDIAMYNHGYMRGPNSYHRLTYDNPEQTCRFEYGTGSYTIRYVLGRVELKQGNENWLRIKTLNNQQLTNPVGLDFVELVPTSVLDNQQFAEDWY